MYCTLPQWDVANTIFVGVDGTGTGNDEKYAQAKQYSHTRMLCSWVQSLGATAHYFRGPTLAGSETAGISAAALEELEDHHYFYTESKVASILGSILGAPDRPFQHQRPAAHIILAGFSRGGLAVMEVARKLGRPVDALLLFDAVDRTPEELQRRMVGSKVNIIPGVRMEANRPVPSNVRFCAHARRYPETDSRPSFGNTGTRAANPGATRYVEKFFWGTHGAIGGVPQDSDSSGGWSAASGAWLMGGPVTWAIASVAQTASRPATVTESGRRTNVTAQQNQEATYAVWTWMMDQLQSGLTPPSQMA